MNPPESVPGLFLSAPKLCFWIPGSNYLCRLLVALTLLCVKTAHADIVVNYNSATEIPITVADFSAAGQSFGATLNFAPAVGTNLMVIRNTGASPIDGTFNNLAQGDALTLSYGGLNYRFVVNYYGGNGNDFVLQWPRTRTVAWGANSAHQLNDRTTTGRTVPVSVLSNGALAGQNAVTMAAGDSYTLGLRADGTLVAWGDPTSGKLGSGNQNGSAIDSSVPVAVDTSGLLTNRRIVAIAAGASHSVALSSDNTVLSWGRGSEGEMGNNSTNDSYSPTGMLGLSGDTVVSVAAGDRYSLGLCSNGSVLVWGYNGNGRLGNGNTVNRTSPTFLSGSALTGKKMAAVSAGSAHGLGLCTDNTLVAWGYNNSGQLGNNSTTSSLGAIKVTTTGALLNKTVIAIAAGGSHSLALCSDGTLVAWGLNNHGQLGNSTTTNSTVPTSVNITGVLNGKTVVAIAACYESSLALCSDGTLAAWGAGSAGTLGNNTSVDSSIPTLVSTASLATGECYMAIFSSSQSNHVLGVIALPLSPTIETLTSSNLTRNSVTLNGSVDPGGNATTAQFAYGLTTSYGSVANVALSPNNGAGAQSVSANLGGLTAGTVYHYRLTATNAFGASASADGTFTTASSVAANYLTASDIPVTASSFSATGETFSATLNFAPVPGTDLTVIKNTGAGFITGAFSNLAQGAIVTLSYGGINYPFIANYYGGSGNDLVLQWAKTRLAAWGKNDYGQIGNNSFTTRLAPTSVVSTGVLAGKTVVFTSAATTHTLALCSDGTVAAWGSNTWGELGNGTGTNSAIPVAVNTDGALAGKTVVAVSAGDDYSLALCSDGTVVAWGENYGKLGNNDTADRLVPVAVNAAGALAGKTITAIAAGKDSSLALSSDGRVFGWGSNYFNQLGFEGNGYILDPAAVPNDGVLAGKSVVAVSISSDHAIALCSDGTVLAWGNNENGQLGNGSTNPTPAPVAVDTSGVLAGKTVVAVAAGDFHSLVLCSDGTVAAWGQNYNGQLGNNSTTASLVPVAVDTTGALFGKKVITIAAGKEHSLVRCSDGALIAWGHNNTGQLGNDINVDSSVPVAVSSGPLANGERYNSAFSGSTAIHNLALVGMPLSPVATNLPLANLSSTSVKLNGRVNPWGVTTVAQFRYGTSISYDQTATITLSPSDGAGDQNVSVNLSGLASATTYHYCLTATNAIGTVSTADGTFTTGINVVGTYNSATDVPFTAANVQADNGTFSITLNFAPPAGTSLTLIRNTGFGSITGRLSDLAQGQELTLSYGGVNYRFIANYYGGSGNDLVLQAAGTRPMAWGQNNGGQLGDGSMINRLTPTSVPTTGALAGRTVIAGGGGSMHSLVLCSDGVVAAWGNNGSGRLGNGGTTSSLIPWTIYTGGVLLNKTIVAVAVGRSFNMVLCSDGTLATWGTNTNGQLGNFSTTDSTVAVKVNTSFGALSGKTVTSITAGSMHGLALCSDGTVAAWGNNTSGQLGNSGNSFSNTVPVAVSTAGVLASRKVVALGSGSFHSLALCSDGTLVAWGSNTSGQLGNNSTTSSLVPVIVNTTGVLAGKSIVAMSGGIAHTMVLCSDGTIATWGDNSSGQLGNNSTVNSSIPVAVNTSGVLAGKTVVAIATGSSHSLATCSDGTTVAWGANSNGQLGNNSTSNSSVPVLVSKASLAAGENYATVFSGSDANHSLVFVGEPPFPAVTTLDATNLVDGGVTLNGTVNAAGGSAAVTFNYGLTNAYGNTIDSVLTPVTGSTNAAVSTVLPSLVPNTVYHFRVRATNAGGTTNGGDMTFTSPPDTAGPASGTVVLAPVSTADPNAAVTVNFANWTDPSTPLAYEVLLDGTVVSIQGASPSRGITAPGTVGPHVLLGRVYDALGHVTELTQNLQVNNPQESWRMAYFGTAQNTGAAADSADPDGDGSNNLFEYVAGLLPKNSASHFSVRIEAVNGEPSQRAITFGPLVAGRSYAVKFKARLTDATWTPLPNTTMIDNGTERTVTDLSAGSGVRFYTVEVTLP